MSDTVLFEDRRVQGPWLLVRPDIEGGDKFERWIRARGDFHFKVVGFIPADGENLFEV